MQEEKARRKQGGGGGKKVRRKGVSTTGANYSGSSSDEDFVRAKVAGSDSRKFWNQQPVRGAVILKSDILAFVLAHRS